MHQAPRPSAEIISLAAYRAQREALKNTALRPQQKRHHGGTPLMRRRIDA